jgi:DNA repair protein RecN (Recombination protein N)
VLRELRIKNVAIIDDLDLEFGPGLNVITGETGAGKSILLRSLGLLCGERASTELVRGDAEQATVEGVFDFTLDDPWVDSLGLDPDDDAIVVRRQVTRSGKGRITVNGATATASMLRQLGAHLVNIYGQHDQALLLRPANHLDYLDDFAGNGEARRAMRRAFEDLKAAQRQLQELDARARQLTERKELLEFQHAELSAAALVEGEETQLQSDRERLRHAEQIARICREGDEVIYSSSDAMTTRLSKILAEIETMAEIVPDLASPAELVEQGRLHLEEAALQLRAISSHTQSDPAQLEQIEERMAQLKRLAKKFAAPIAELPAFLARVEEELSTLQSHGENRNRAAEAVEGALREATRLATILSGERREIGRRLEQAMQRELGDLGMAGGVFKVEQETSAMLTIDDLGPTGADRIEFFLSANRGEPVQPLARVASGGELSRILLALKALTAAIAETPVLIFDEVDAGIGGTVADAVARKLRVLAENRQILCITHLPQIAACADHHYAVEKTERGGRTVSETRALQDRERVAELSRMLGSSSDEAVRYARELIAQGKKPSRRAKRGARPGA